MGGFFTITNFRKVIHVITILALSAGIFFTLQPAQVVQAGAIIQVNSTLDRLSNDGKCTLREAVISANKNARSGSKANECAAGSKVDGDTVLLPDNLGDFVLTRADNGREDSGSTGDLDIVGSLTIESSGKGVTIVGVQGDRVFHILSGVVTLRKLNIRGSKHAGSGGGVYNASTLTLDRVTVSGNQADGSGGGVYNAAKGVLSMLNSTLSANSAGTDGGGLMNSGTATLNNVTIAFNSADANADGSGEGGGAASAGGSLKLSNTVLAGNIDKSPLTQRADCSGALVSLGYNLVQNPTGCTFTPVAGDQLGADPLLGSLQDNGGGFLTHTLLDGSPAMDAASPAVPGSGGAACLVIDQRGSYRPHGRFCDTGALEAGSPNASVLIRAFSDAASTTVVGRLDSAPNTTFSLQLYSGSDPDLVCSAVSGGALLGSAVSVTTNPDGDAIFQTTVNSSVPRGELLTAVVSDPGGFASSASRCIRVGAGNDSWPHALPLTLNGLPEGQAAAEDFIDLPGQSRWFKFTVQPDSRLVVTLTGLPANYDLTLYKDIGSAFNQVDSQADLLQLGAEFAPDAFTPDAFTADVFSPDAFTPDAFTPDAFTPDAFTPDAFTPDAFTPDAFTPDAFTPDAFTPDAFTPDAFTPDAFTPDAFTPDAFTPDAFTPDAFSSAQTRSLIAVSAFEGRASEGIRLNTWDNAGEFYVRVRGRNAAFDPQTAFHLEVKLASGLCAPLSGVTLPPSTFVASAGNYRTLILTNPLHVEGTPEDSLALPSALQSLADRPEVVGMLVDVSQDERVAAAYALADANPACPSAANLAAQAVKGIVDNFRQANPGLEYLVIVGNDRAIPFFRHPDHSMLASEKNFIPPVLDFTASQASLRQGYVLSQDDYGAVTLISYKDDQLPLPSIPVGRLVETASDILAQLNAYLSTAQGVVTPSSALVTGYDFLEDAAVQVGMELEAGLGLGALETLISPRDMAPTHPDAWTADDLRQALLGQRHDLVFLAGHFSANSALAADYTTRLLAAEVADSDVDMTNTLVFSLGCHAGYNIVNPHGVPFVTREPDWAQTFAGKGAALIAGTGYQYGDTDFVKYGERLYLLFSQKLRTGDSGVSIGDALVAAKQAYLVETPYLRGIDEKTLLETTLFGLPMLRFDLPGARLTPENEPSQVTVLSDYPADPGAFLGLQHADITLTPALTLNSVLLENIQNPADAQTAVYLSGSDGVVTKPNEPVLPLENVNVSFPGTVLRGVGFRGGTYADLAGVLALTGASATEIRGVHLPFLSDIPFPAKPWTLNYFDALAGGATWLAVTPAQYFSASPASTTGTLRRFDQMSFRLFYSDNISTYDGGTSTPALAAPPTIASVASSVSTGVVNFKIRVVGNPAAGIQEVWVTYTDLTEQPNGHWAPLDLQQNLFDSTLWEGSLPLNGADSHSLRYFVQAANGVGLVSMDTNQGEYYIPAAGDEPTEPTLLEFVVSPSSTSIPSSGRYSTPVTLSAKLTSSGMPLPDQVVAFGLGPQSRRGVTGADGIATVTLSIFGLPGESEARASFAGAGIYENSTVIVPFAILKQDTLISLSPQPALGKPSDMPLLTATLTDVDGRRLGDETILFMLTGSAGSYVEALITDYAGRATLGNLPLPAGSYQVDAYFGGEIPALGITLIDDRYNPAFTRGSLVLKINSPPVCSGAATTLVSLWSPNGGMYHTHITGVSDPDGDPLIVTITDIFQDEPVGNKIDAAIHGSDFWLRAERDGNGDGRVYHIFFSLDDGKGGSCAGEILLGVVPHDQGSSLEQIDGGALYDSTVAQ